MKRRAARMVLLLACLAWAGASVAARSETVQTDQHASKRTSKHAGKEPRKHVTTHASTRAAAQAHAYARAHAPAHDAVARPGHRHRRPHEARDRQIQKAALKTSHKPDSKPARALAAKAARPAGRVAAAAATAAVTSTTQAATRRAHPAADPGGEGFLDLYAELCVKRIDDLDTFHEKLLRKKIPKLQPDSAQLYLAGEPGDAWPVPYKGKVGNFVLVLAENRNLCMLYARRTDTSAVEQGFADMVARPPEPMLARRGPRTHDALDGATRTVSMSWAPPRAQRRIQLILTTSRAADARVQAVASVEIVSGLESTSGPEATAAAKLTRPPGGSPAPARRLRAQP